jgi:hypothetical protein
MAKKIIENTYSLTIDDWDKEIDDHRFELQVALQLTNILQHVFTCQLEIPTKLIGW